MNLKPGQLCLQQRGKLVIITLPHKCNKRALNLTFVDLYTYKYEEFALQEYHIFSN